MSRRVGRILAVGGALGCILAAVILVDASGDDLLVGLAILLFCVALVVGGMGAGWPGRGPAVRIGSVVLDGVARRGLIFPLSRRAKVLSVLGLLCMAGASRLMGVAAEELSQGDDPSMTRLVAFGSVLLFCAVGVVQIPRLVRHRDFFLGVFPDGIGHLGSAVSWFVPWPVLTGVDLDQIHHRGGRTVFLRFDVRERIPIDGAPPLRWMHTLPRRDRDAALTVPVHVLLAPPDRVIATIQRYQADEAARATLDALADPPSDWSVARE